MLKNLVIEINLLLVILGITLTFFCLEKTVERQIVFVERIENEAD